MRIDRIKLKTDLVKKDMKQSELAAIAGLSRSTIAGVIGGRSCSFTTAEKISEALKIPLDKLKEVN